MKKILLFFAVAFIAVSCIKISRKEVEVKRVTEVRDLKGFKSVNIIGSTNVHYRQDSVWSVKVVAAEEMMENVKTEVIGARLIISQKGIGYASASKVKIGDKTFVFGSSDVDVMVSSPDLIGVSVQGSGDFSVQGKVDTDNIDVCMNGSGEIKCPDILCDSLRTELVGSGSIVLSKVDAFDADAMLVGSGDLKMSLQNVHTSNLLLKGSGDMVVDFIKCGSVTASLNGSGDICINGEVKTLEKEKLGSGDYKINIVKQ